MEVIVEEHAIDIHLLLKEVHNYKHIVSLGVALYF